MNIQQTRNFQNISETTSQHTGPSTLDQATHQQRLNTNQASARSITIPEVSGLYHQRTPELNQIQIFFSQSGNEPPPLKALAWEPCIPLDLSQLDRTSLYNLQAKASTAEVDRYLGTSKSRLHELHNHIIQQLPPEFLHQDKQRIHVISPALDHHTPAEGLHFLSFCTQSEIARTLNLIEKDTAKTKNRPAIKFTDYKHCLRLSRSQQEAHPLTKLVAQPYFATDDIAPDDQVVLVHDHAEQGAELLAMASAIRSVGGKVLGMYALTNHAYNTDLSLHPKVHQELTQTLNHWDPKNEVASQLNKLGLSLSTLTNAEAMLLLAYITHPHRPQEQARFQELHQLLTPTHQKDTNLHPTPFRHALDKIPETPQTVCKQLETLSTEKRRIVQNVPITHVDVFDWDCCISNEKSMHFQVMANSLAIVAHNYKTQHPELEVIRQAMAPHWNGEHYAEGMPKICMGKEAFSTYAITHPPMWEMHMIKDLFSNLKSIAPALALNPIKQRQLISILDAEMHRQYHHTMHQGIPPAVQQRMDELRNRTGIELPFKRIELEYMPSAKAFLEQSKRPHAKTFLISNRGDFALKNEVQKLGTAHLFEVVSGNKTRSRGQKTTSLYIKPNPYRMNKAFEHHALQHRPVHIRLIGDQKQDVTQAAHLLKNPHGQTLEGIIINPAHPKELIDGKIQGIATQHHLSFDALVPVSEEKN